MVFKLADTQKKKTASCVPGTVLSILYTLIKSILITTSSSSYFHVINEENEDKLSKVTYLQVAEVGLTQTHPAPVWVLAAGTKSPGWKSMTLPWTSLPVRLAPSRLMPICLHRPLALCVSEGVRHCAGRRGGDSQASMGSPPNPHAPAVTPHWDASSPHWVYLPCHPMPLPLRPPVGLQAVPACAALCTP